MTLEENQVDMCPGISGAVRAIGYDYRTQVQRVSFKSGTTASGRRRPSER